MSQIMQLNEERNNDQLVIDEGNRDEQEQSLAPKAQKTYKSFKKLLFRIINLCLASFYFGYSLGYLGSFTFDVIADIFSITANQSITQGLLQGCVTVGGGVGALASSIVMKKFSRRNSILFINLIALFAGVIILIPSLGLLYFGRILQGICTGMYSALIPLLIKQFSPTQAAGTFGALNQTFIASGVFFSFLFQWILSEINDQKYHWRMNFGFPLLTITVQTLLLLFVYKEETPKYYLQNGQESKCVKLLEKIYKAEYVEKILEEKKNDLNMIQSQANTQNLDKAQKNQIQMQENQDKNFDTLQEDPTALQKIVGIEEKGKGTRKKLAIHLAILQQMIGINAVVVYGVQIAAEILPSLAVAIPSLLNLQQIIATLVSSYLLSKFGRKVILQLGTLTAGTSLVLIAAGFMLKNHNIHQFGSALIIIGLIVFMGNFGVSLGPLVWLYIAEIIQPKFIPFSTLANWSASSIVIITFPILSNKFGSPVPLFIFFAVWTFTSYFINKKYLLETKGKTQRQIREQYKLI